MTPYTFFFLGRSGSGKGTQSDLLIQYFKEHEPQSKVVYVETGFGLRELIKGDSFSAELTKEVVSKGGLMPAFIPIWVWADFFIKNLTGQEHLILDGLARNITEAPILDNALQFYKRPKPFVIHLNLSDEVATKHLMSRGRTDDTKESIATRLQWFSTNVEPSINYFKKIPYYESIEINGDQSIEDVHKEILNKTGIASPISL